MHGRRILLQRWFQRRFGTGELFYSHYAYFDEANTTTDPFRGYLMRTLPVYFTYSKNERLDRSMERSKFWKYGFPGAGRGVQIARAAATLPKRFLLARAMGGAFLVCLAIQMHVVVWRSVIVLVVGREGAWEIASCTVGEIPGRVASSVERGCDVIRSMVDMRVLSGCRVL